MPKAILLGASEFAHKGLPSNDRFRHSNSRVSDYLRDHAGLAIAGDDILDLFNSKESPSDQIVAIRNWLTERPSNEEGDFLVVYYVGHGAFWDSPDYLLATRRTTEDLEAATSLRVADLATALAAFKGGKFLVLDACYAAAALADLQADSASLQAKATQSAMDAVPSGTVLLAAASRDTTAQAPKSLEVTLFTQALLEVLYGRFRHAEIDEGVSVATPYSARDLHYQVKKYLSVNHSRARMQPEIHEPRQRDEQLADARLFPVAGFTATTGDRELFQRLGEVATGLADLGTRVRQQERFGPWLALLTILVGLVLLYQVYQYRRSLRPPPNVVLLTDFGDRSYYPGAFKGKVLQHLPEALFIAATNTIRPHDPLDAAWNLYLTSRSYPAGTVFVALVNPGGLGTSEPLVLRTKNNLTFVGYENGVFDFVVEQYGIKSAHRIGSKELTPAKFSDSGFDFIAPTVAQVVYLRPLSELGPRLDSYTPGLDRMVHRKIDDRSYEVSIIDIDRFGNITTSLSEEEIASVGGRRGSSLRVRIAAESADETPSWSKNVPYQKTYSDVAKGAVVGIISDGYFQLALNEAPLAESVRQAGVPVEPRFRVLVEVP